MTALWQRAEKLREGNPTLRRGQALFIALTELNPEKADRIRGTECDPFFSNCRIKAFLLEVEGK
jgi:hypothetical protein